MPVISSSLTVTKVTFPFFPSTVFICSFMVAAPIFGYLGDRFNRKIILSCGIFFWSTVTLLSSFIGKEVRRSSRSRGNRRSTAAGKPPLPLPPPPGGPSV